MNEYPHEIISCMEFQLHSIIQEIMQTFTQALNFSNSSVARDFDWSVARDFDWSVARDFDWSAARNFDWSVANECDWSVTFLYFTRQC